MRERTARFALGALIALLAGARGDAQVRRATTHAPSASPSGGLELELHGTAQAAAGHDLILRGVTYSVSDLATLRALPHAHVTAALAIQRENETERVEAGVRVDADESGRFAVSIPVPLVDARRAEVRIDVTAGSTTRRFVHSVAIVEPFQLDLLSDRTLYEPGETMHAWARVLERVSRAPIGGRRLRLSVVSQNNDAEVVTTREATTSDMGALSFDVPLDQDAGDRGLTLRVISIDDGIPLHAETNVRVGRRSIERVNVTVAYEHDVVAPGEMVRGVAIVRAASGAPIAGAQVELRHGNLTTTVTTGADGRATFAWNAPVFAPGSVQWETAAVRAVHPAAGSARTNASYVVSAAPYQVAITMGHDGAIPEIDSPIYIAVTDPHGQPAPRGTRVRVTGRVIGARPAEAVTDSHGFAVVSVHAPLDAIAEHEGGDCSGSVAGTVDVEVTGRDSLSTRACVRVARDAMVRVEARTPVVAPGGVLRVRLTRRAQARTRSVAIDLVSVPFYSIPMVLGSFVVGPGVENIELPVPQRFVGVLAVRARPVLAGDTAEGTGSLDAVLVRPTHAFDLRLTADHHRYHPRDTAHITAESPAGVRDGAIAFVVRDLAAHAGERDFARWWLDAQLANAVISPETEDNERLVRTALAAILDPDLEPVRADPLVRPDGEEPQHFTETTETRRGDLRDPFARRDELTRRGVGDVMRALEAGIEADLAAGSDAVLDRTGGRAHFKRDAIASLVSLHRITPEAAQTLGAAPLTVAVLERASLGFDFEHAARRVTRARMVRLLAALLGPIDPGEDTPSPLAADPPDRWLSRLVTWGRLPNSSLRDPWGGAFVLHRVQGRRPAVTLGARVLDWELASPGPDGVIGTADDVRDPFERVVPADTTYSVASGEDELMRRLAALDPGADALQQMLAAYRRIGAGAHEETVGDVVSARDSEGTAFGSIGLGNIGTVGHGSGTGSGQGYGAGAGRGLRTTTSSLSGLASLLRERFPATLMFVGERALDPSGHTTFDVPLADALTTFRVEAIAWTAEGWTTSARTEIEVDQDVVVDAPIPAVATPGDTLRVPVRLSNRGDHAIRVRVALALEGLEAHAGDAAVVSLDRGESREVPVVLDGLHPSSGRVRITATDDASGAALDAVRRPMEIVAEARPAVAEAITLVDRAGEMRLDVPADASARANGVVRITAGTAVVEDPATWGVRESDTSWAGWALAMADRTIPSALSRLGMSGRDRGDFARVARAIGARWADRDFDDETLRFLLAHLSSAFDTRRRNATATPAADEILLGLVPAIVHRDARPAIREALDGVVRRLQRGVDSAASSAVEQGDALALAGWLLRSSSAQPSPRADEYLRRAMRSVQTHGEGLVLEGADGSVNARVRASSILGLAMLAGSDRATAFRLAREIGDRDTMRGTRDPAARALAYALFARLTTRPTATTASSATIRIDGVATTVPLENGEAHVTSPVLSRPGSHTIAIQLASPAVLRAGAVARFGLPWSRNEPMRAPLEIVLDGPVGARDTRSAMWLRIRNRGPRVLAHSIARIELPAGAEIDDEARRDLAARLGGQPVTEGRTLTLPLRSLPPGGSARLPLRIRWTLGGTLRGLGVVVRTDDGPAGATAILGPRAVEVPDRGEEPR